MKSVVGHDADDIIADARERATSMEDPKSLFTSITVTRQTSMKIFEQVDTKWFLGVGVYVVGQLINLVSLSFIEQVLWAVLSLSSLVANLVFSRIILHEHIHLSDILYTCMIIVGSGLVVVANSNSIDAGLAPEKWTLGELIGHFKRPWFIVYCSIIGSLFVGCLLWGMHSVTYGDHVHALAWTILSATCGSVSTLLGKCCSYMVSMVSHDSEGTMVSILLSSLYTYIIIILFLIAAIAAFVTLNMALAAGEAMLVVPWLTVSSTILTILGGMLYFEEFSSFRTVKSSFFFTLGLLVAIAGAILLQRAREGSQVPSNGEHSALLAAPHSKGYRTSL